MTELKMNLKCASVKKAFATFLAICVCITSLGLNVNAAGSSDQREAEAGVVTPDSVALSVTQMELEEGESKTLVATVSPDNATDTSVSWKSSDDAVATVDSDGKVTAVSEGTATITAETVNGKAATCEVRVTAKEVVEPEPGVVTPDSITLSVTQMELKEGESGTIVATVSPDNAADKTVNWKSSDDAVATVDSDGKVTAVSEGTATITAETVNGKEATCEVRVTAKEVTPDVVTPDSITLSVTQMELEEGESGTIVATVSPDNAADTSVSWKSSDDAVATVDSDGKVTAVSEGTATITATTVNGKEATCKVIVKASSEIAATGITLSKTSLALNAGAKETLTATIAPANTTNKAVTWTTSNSKIATVVNGTVTAVANGTATITATTVNGKTANCTVTVTTAATSVSLSKTSLALNAGAKAALTATVAPATASNKTVTWTTSNSKVATVVNGTVTAVANGTAVITATTVNGKTARCTVTVTTAVTKVTLDKTAVLTVGKSKTLKATVAPATASNKKITWKTSNSKVVTVTSSGKITGKKAGTATITATASNGVKATCKVTVAELKLNASSIAVQVGKSTSALKVSSKYPTKDSVTYKSSNTKIATVSKTGKITGKKVGSATITVTSKSGVKATCKVTVQKGKVVTKSLKMSSKSATLLKGKKLSLKVTRNPISATEKITWTTSNKKVATVDKNGKVTAKGPGTATITAKTSNGKKATCKITVPGVTLQKTSATIKKGKTVTIKVKSTIVKKDKVVSYKTSNKKVATVDKKGKVKGIKKGSATITVTMKSGATATFKVKVK